MRTLVLLSLAALLSGCILEPATSRTPEDEAPAPPPAHSPYVGQEAREIKALSPDDIRGYREGAGLGYAKPAELNSYPGPLHALEMEHRLQLTPEQTLAIQRIREDMLAQAKPLGERYLLVEGEIEQRFRDDAMDRDALAALLNESAAVEAQLRYVHLAAHLDTKALLTPHQVALYDEARGYGEADHASHDHGA